MAPCVVATGWSSIRLPFAYFCPSPLPPPSCWSRGSSDPMFLPFPRLTQPSFVSPDHRVLSTLSQGYCLPSAPPEQAGAPHCPSLPNPRRHPNGRFPAVSGLPFETSCTLSAGVHPDPRSAHCIPIRVPFVCLVTKRPHLDFPPAQPPQPSSSHSPFGSRLKPVGEPGTPPPVSCAAPHRKARPVGPGGPANGSRTSAPPFLGWIHPCRCQVLLCSVFLFRCLLSQMPIQS